MYRKRVCSGMMLRAYAETSRIPVVCAGNDTALSGPPTSASTTMRQTIRRDMAHLHSSGGRHQAVETRFEAVLAKRLGDPCVVDGRIGVDPIALRIDREG